MLTLGQCRNARSLQRISGIPDPTGPAFADLVNEGFRRLMKRGDWFQTVVPIYVCVFQGCVVWPRYVSEVRRINQCNRQIPVNSLWFPFMFSGWRDCSWHHWHKHHDMGMTQQGQSVTFQDIFGDGRLVRAYARQQLDLGKNLTIFGVDNNNQPLQTLNADGTVTPGAVITLANPFGSTNTFVRRIDNIIKDPTQDIVDVYAYNASTNLLEDIVHLEPNDTNPSFTRYKLHLPPNWGNGTCGTSTPSCCGSQFGVIALVKLKFIQAVFDSDLILFDDLDALKKIMMSIIREDANDIEGAKAFETDAIHELNRTLEEHEPDDVFAASDNTLGPRVWSNSMF